jgi:hypothetical protein
LLNTSSDVLKLKTRARTLIAGAVRVHEERRAAHRRRPQVRARGEASPFLLFPGLVHLQQLSVRHRLTIGLAENVRCVQLLGVGPLQAGNVVQLLVVLGMTVGWISTYMANKDMTYAHQLRDYEKQVMEVTRSVCDMHLWMWFHI